MLIKEPNPGFALNHITVPGVSWQALVAMAARLACVGVEFRTDVLKGLFGGDAPGDVGMACRDAGLRILALAEVSRFNDASPVVLDAVTDLANIARKADAEAIVLIPRIGGAPASFEKLCDSLDKIGPRLADQGMRGLIEPIGFQASSLRDFDLARRAIKATHGSERFGLIHDTFHHHLAGGGAVSADCVDLVHVSGVASTRPVSELEDSDRGLVGEDDTLGTVEQIRMLTETGHHGPVSMEVFSPEVQQMGNPELALRASYDFIRSNLTAHAA